MTTDHRNWYRSTDMPEPDFSIAQPGTDNWLAVLSLREKISHLLQAIILIGMLGAAGTVILAQRNEGEAATANTPLETSEQPPLPRCEEVVPEEQPRVRIFMGIEELSEDQLLELIRKIREESLQSMTNPPLA